MINAVTYKFVAHWILAVSVARSRVRAKLAEAFL
jgi:hypothetical protein